MFYPDDALKMGVAEESSKIGSSTLMNISQHSIDMFDKCL